SDRKTLFVDQADIEQHKIRRAIGDHVERFGDVSRGPYPLHPKTRNRVLEIERDNRIILDNQHVVGQRRQRSGGGGVHRLTDKRYRTGNRSWAWNRACRWSLTLQVPIMKPSRRGFSVCSLVHITIQNGQLLSEPEGREVLNGSIRRKRSGQS